MKKKLFSKILQNSEENKQLVFKIFKNAFFTEYLWTTASGYSLQLY